MTHDFIISFRSKMHELAKSEYAEQMQAYMKTKQAFYGVNAPAVNETLRSLYKNYSLSEEEIKAICWELWNGNFREEMYASIKIVEKYHRLLLTSENFSYFKKYFKRVENWDQLDPLASNILGMIFLKDRSFSKEISLWSFDKNMWIRRASLLVHLKHRNNTDQEMLAFSIQQVMKEKEFFIRKAIGWVLRSYSDYNPKWVIHFVESNPELSNLSKKEALRKIVK